MTTAYARAPAPPTAVRPAAVPLGALRRQAPLLAVLAVQAALTMSLRNTAFQDEALYLYAGHRQIAQLRDGAPTFDDYATYFSGAPWFYPLLGATADAAGGLLAARALSLVLMLGATVLLAGLTRRLFDRNSGVLAAGVFAVAGPTLFMGRLATFDAPAVFLLALASWIVVVASRRPALLWTAPPVLVATVAIKYAALLFVPTVIGLAVLVAIPRRGWWRALLRAGTLAALSAGLAGVVLALAGSRFVRGLAATTTARPEGTDPVGTVLSESAGYVVAPLLLSLVGTALIVRTAPTPARRLRAAALGALLTGTALLAPAYQAHLHTLTSLQKHAGYGLLFAAPLAGYALARLVGEGARDPRRLGLALAVCLLLTTVGVRQAQRRFHDWPDASPLVAVLRTQVRPVTGRYLVEESEVPRYYLRDLIEPYQWTGTYYFEYRDRAGRQLTGVPAYRAALAEGYFDLVALRYGPTAGLDVQIDPLLRDPRRYEQIAQVPADSSFGSGAYTVWRAVK